MFTKAGICNPFRDVFCQISHTFKKNLGDNGILKSAEMLYCDSYYIFRDYLILLTFSPST